VSGRTAVLVALGTAAAVVLGVGGYALAGRTTEAGGGSGSAAAAVSTTQSSESSTATSTASVPSTDEGASIAPPPPPQPITFPRPKIIQDPIPYSASRRAQMAEYARRHYGTASSALRPRMIVVHFTASGAGSYPGVHATFSSNAPNRGESPGVCAHFVVDQDGTIYQLVPLNVMCRHTIGLNDRSVGIEMVQEGGASSHWADQQILHRPRQITSVLRLVRWLQDRYDIGNSRVIGHAMANDSPFFRDLEGWRNDHTDWQPEDVAQLRAML
jgi:N-acetylmuramoyl-L-alanine amidase-like protein